MTEIIAQPGIAGLVADFIEGPTLESAIQSRQGAPTVDEVKAVFLPLLDGLAHAHARGIVHRDIKPSNIVLDQGRPGQSVPRIIDFGIAKITESPHGPLAAKGKTRTGVRMGTLHYMSPEQIRGQSDVDARADIFSMAVTLFEFITGQVPFEADSDFDTMKQIVEGHPTPIRRLQPNVDPILEACIMKGLARDRESRFESCGELAAQLRQASQTAVREAPLVSVTGVTRRSSLPASASSTLAPEQPPVMVAQTAAATPSPTLDVTAQVKRDAAQPPRRRARTLPAHAGAEAADSRGSLHLGPHPERRWLWLVPVACGLLTLLAVVSFHPGDDGAWDAGRATHNWVGPVGHGVAWLLFHSVGISAYGLVAMIITLMVIECTPKLRRLAPIAAFGWVLTGSMTSALSYLLTNPAQWGYPPGGALGRAIGDAARGAFTLTGSLIVLFALLLMAILLATHFAALRAFEIAARGVGNVSAKAARHAYSVYDRCRRAPP